MRRDTLARLGREVWGAGWAWELARALGRHPDSIGRWRCGTRRMSTQDHYLVAKTCLEASKERHANVRQMVKTLRSYEPAPRLRRKRMRKAVSLYRHMRRLAKGPVE